MLQCAAVGRHGSGQVCRGSGDMNRPPAKPSVELICAYVPCHNRAKVEPFRPHSTFPISPYEGFNETCIFVAQPSVSLFRNQHLTIGNEHMTGLGWMGNAIYRRFGFFKSDI